MVPGMMIKREGFIPHPLPAGDVPIILQHLLHREPGATEAPDTDRMDRDLGDGQHLSSDHGDHWKRIIEEAELRCIFPAELMCEQGNGRVPIPIRRCTAPWSEACGHES
jgi:hypothetical protein